MATQDWQRHFINGFRLSAPYIHAHRGKTFVLVFGGEAVADTRFPGLVHDIALLHSLGIRLVLVHGARPQIEARLKSRKAKMEYANGLRITDDAALECVKEAAGTLRVEIEALLSMGLANTPMAGARIGASSGNFVIARPVGIREGIDYCHTGEVRRIDGAGIRQHLDNNRIVLLSPLGYSPTGEVFNITAEDIATAAATELQAEKLILMSEAPDLRDGSRRRVTQLSLTEASALLQSRRKLPEDTTRHIEHAVHACRHGVGRTHIISRNRDGALLLELFTRDGNGTLITAGIYEGLRKAGINDVGGILELIKPLEDEGILVKRSRERLEMEIDHFHVIERDGTIIACAALYPGEGRQVAELACLAVHADYRDAGRGDALLQAIESRARQTGIRTLFVLTTRTAHWFRERGFEPGDIAQLPVRKKRLYNYRRKSKVFIKQLDNS
jgi:amino-acid N-acetyltransferase